MPPADDKFWKGVFRGLNNELHWLESADKLKRGADVLFATNLESCELSPEERSQTGDRNLDGVATLLYGLAMENILKAVLIKEGIAKISTDGSVNWNVNGADEHDLVTICRSSNLICLNAGQEKLMERMSAFVHWAGKYPTPWKLKNPEKAFKGLLLSNQPKAAPVTMPVEFEEDDKIKFEELYQILWKKAFPIDSDGMIA